MHLFISQIFYKKEIKIKNNKKGVKVRIFADNSVNLGWTNSAVEWRPLGLASIDVLGA